MTCVPYALFVSTSKVRAGESRIRKGWTRTRDGASFPFVSPDESVHETASAFRAVGTPETRASTLEAVDALTPAGTLRIPRHAVHSGAVE